MQIHDTLSLSHNNSLIAVQALVSYQIDSFGQEIFNRWLIDIQKAELQTVVIKIRALMPLLMHSLCLFIC